ncbi:hypothetical protein COV13_02095 [Candidatus Woesearchaeota archaeon CG10_big_fil_rev_8_21_14_0_10_32_9]|nr:MAG: hypothetical protein COV13_02095 [Candidatus Woesearchaeota archaeon CG10_big_fil_rev_8_21_14_0_10_32_9]
MSFIKKAGGFLAYFALSIVLINLFMSFFLGSFTDKIPGVMGNVYDYASPGAKQQLNEKFTTMCTGVIQIIKENKSIDQQILEQCSAEKKKVLKQMCSNLDVIPQDQQTTELLQTCEAVNSGEFDKFCEDAQNSEETQVMDYSQVSDTCKKLIDEEITHKEFFVQLTNDSMSQLDGEGISNLVENNKELPAETKTFLMTSQTLMNTSTQSLIIQGVIILILSFLLRLTCENDAEFLKKYSKLFISLAVLILVPFILLQLYLVAYPPNTDQFVTMMTQSTGSEMSAAQAVPVIFPLVLDSMFTGELLIAAIAVLAFGILLKVAQLYS